MEIEVRRAAARSLAHEGRHASALTQLRHVLDHDPGNATDALAAATSLAATSRYREARAQVASVLLADASNGTARSTLLRYVLDDPDTAAAITHILEISGCVTGVPWRLAGAGGRPRPRGSSRRCATRTVEMTIRCRSKTVTSATSGLGVRASRRDGFCSAPYRHVGGRRA